LIRTLIKNWWLLALCGVLDAIMSVISFNHAGHGFAYKTAIVFTGKLALAAGISAIAAGLWRSTNGTCWLLVLNGVALATLGLVFNGVFGFRISFRTVALLIIVMAVSLGILAVVNAAALWRWGHIADSWALGSAGVVSVGFALVFLAFGVGWIKLTPGSPGQSLLLLGSYFGFSAICMLATALRLVSHGPPQSSPREASPRIAHPRHAQ
jgi:uncharacterized membrane protein HdeD (DUF308 family)